MRLTLVPKDLLSPGQHRYLSERLSAPEHRSDSGQISVWHLYGSHLYAFVHKEFDIPNAISEASGRPIAIPGWWIDQQFRGEGYGNELVDLLASHLAADGVVDIGVIPIGTYKGQYHEQSRKLARRLRAKFAEAQAAQNKHVPDRFE